MIGQEFKQESFSEIFKNIDSLMDQTVPKLKDMKKDGLDVSAAEKVLDEIMATKAEMSEKLKDIFKDNSK